LDINKLILYERKRGDCYRLLSACFYLPKKELFLEEGLFKNLSMLLKSICPGAAIFSAEMEEAIREYNNEDLSVEYAKLFVGPYDLKAPPYGSVYLEGGRRVMGDSTMEVIKSYHEEGLYMDEDFKELPDHIAVELEFMNYLIYKEIDTYMKSKFEDAMEVLRHQELFLKKYLGAWISNFSKAIIENSDNPFYISLAKCTEVFIKTDMDYISETLRKIL
jgi:TorA maturation chaperone TorD